MQKSIALLRLKEFASSIRSDINHGHWERLANSMIIDYGVRFLDHRQTVEGIANRRSELYQAMKAVDSPGKMACVAHAWCIICCSTNPTGNTVDDHWNDLTARLLSEGFTFSDPAGIKEIYRLGFNKLRHYINRKNLGVDVKVDETLADDETPIELLGFSTLTYCLLKRKKWGTVGQLCGVTVQEFQFVRGIGASKIIEIQKKLRAIGRHLLDDCPTIEGMMELIKDDCDEIINLVAIVEAQSPEAETLSSQWLNPLRDKLRRVKEELEEIKTYLKKSI